MRRFLLLMGMVLSWLMLLAVPTVEGAELLMLERDNCSWCERWRREIGPIYPNTPEAARAPLRVVNIGRAKPDDLDFVQFDIFTPTFVLIDKGREYGRIRGYPGETFFWVRLGDLLAGLPDSP